MRHAKFKFEITRIDKVMYELKEVEPILVFDDKEGRPALVRSQASVHEFWLAIKLWNPSYCPAMNAVNALVIFHRTIDYTEAYTRLFVALAANLPVGHSPEEVCGRIIYSGEEAYQKCKEDPSQVSFYIDGSRRLLPGNHYNETAGDNFHKIITGKVPRNHYNETAGDNFHKIITGKAPGPPLDKKLNQTRAVMRASVWA